MSRKNRSGQPARDRRGVRDQPARDGRPSAAPPDPGGRRPSDAPLDRLDFAIMAACLALAIGARLFIWLHLDPPLAGDFQHYYYLATSLLHGDLRHFVHYHYPPLYPLTMAPLAAIFSSSETSARLAGTLAGALTVVPLYLLGRAIFGRPAAAAGAAFYAMKFLLISVQGGAEPLLVLLSVTGIGLGGRALIQPSARRVAAAAAVFGLAALAKMEGMASFGLWFLWLCARLASQRPRLRAAGLAALAVAMFYLPQSPYLGAFYSDTGHFAINPKLATLIYIHNEPDWSEGSYALHRDAGGAYTVFQRAIIEGDRRQNLSLLDYLKKNGGRLAGLYADRTKFVAMEIVPAVLWNLVPLLEPLAAVLLLLALVGRRRDRPQAIREIYLWSFALLPIVLVPLFEPEMRFFVMTVALLTLVMGSGAERAATGAAGLIGRALKRAPAGAAALLVVFAGLLLTPDLDLMAEPPVKSDYRELVEDRTPPADFIREHLDPGRRIMSMWRTVPYWHLAGIAPDRDLGIPLAPINDVVAYARQEKVEFIVLEIAETETRYPDLVPLFRSDFKNSDLQLAYRAFRPSGRFFLIYRVLDRAAGPPAAAAAAPPALP